MKRAWGWERGVGGGGASVSLHSNSCVLFVHAAVWPLLVFVFFTERQKSPLTLRIADHSLCHRSKHFTPSIVSSPVALVSHPIYIAPPSGVEDGAPFASTICVGIEADGEMTQELRVAKHQIKSIVQRDCIFVCFLIDACHSQGPKGEAVGSITQPLPSSHLIFRAASESDGRRRAVSHTHS